LPRLLDCHCSHDPHPHPKPNQWQLLAARSADQRSKNKKKNKKKNLTHRVMAKSHKKQNQKQKPNQNKEPLGAKFKFFARNASGDIVAQRRRERVRGSEAEGKRRHLPWSGDVGTYLLVVQASPSPTPPFRPHSAPWATATATAAAAARCWEQSALGEKHCKKDLRPIKRMVTQNFTSGAHNFTNLRPISMCDTSKEL